MKSHANLTKKMAAMTTKKNKPIKVLVMSVGDYDNNHTVHYFEKIGGAEHCLVCLPKQFGHNADSYRERNIDVFVYDEKKYINEEFEYFGYKPRNCGGVGRQGIAEAVEQYGKDYICFQVDDDTAAFCVENYKTGKQTTIKSFENLAKLIYIEQEFYETTGIEVMAKTGATISNKFVSNRKIFNNFIMKQGNLLNFKGFAALCSDDQRYNIYRNILQNTPMLSLGLVKIIFHQNQGDRKDGNAVLYNKDCSWKKSFTLKMMFPVAIRQSIKRETNRVLFRECILASKIYPPIFLEEGGKLVAKV